MTDQLPAPLVPPEVDLRDFGFMPLEVQRVRDSDLAAEETPAACWAALLLWCAGWHQVPAGSIPDSERWQAKHAGYLAHGEIDPRWNDVRGGALRGWVKCSDGRLYHPVIAGRAIDAWKAKVEQRWRTECARIKKHNQRHDLSLPIPEFDQWYSSGCPQGQMLPVPRDSAETSRHGPPKVPRETASKGQGEGQGQGQGDSLLSPAAAGRRAAKKAPADFALTPELERWAAEKAPGVDLERETDKFRDHTFPRAISDWPATWRNWIRKAFDDMKTRAPQRRPAGQLSEAERAEANARSTEEAERILGLGAGHYMHQGVIDA